MKLKYRYKSRFNHQATTIIKTLNGVQYGSWSSNTTQDSHFTRGYDIVDFHRLKAANTLLPHTPFDQYRHTGNVLEGEYKQTYANGDVNMYAPLWNHSGINYVVTEERIDDVLAELDANYYVQAAADKLYSGGFDALTFAAEIGLAHKLFQQTALRLIDILRTKSIEQLWLEGRYGWRLLMYDVQELSELVSEIAKERDSPFVTERVGSDSTWIEQSSTISGDSRYLATYNHFDTIVAGRRGSVTARFRPSSYNRSIQVNPYTTAWELVPWSFVVDWIYDVGQWLGALSFLTLSEEHTASQGLDVTISRHTTVDSVENFNGYTTEIKFESLFLGHKTVRLPGKVSIHPLIKLNLSPAKILDLVALLRQLLK